MPPHNEKPIIFSTPMIKAILSGRKTTTRRVIKPLPAFHPLGSEQDQWKDFLKKCKYQIGDRLWVRETFSVMDSTPIYKADCKYPDAVVWKPSIYMPRNYSRIMLEITKLHIERLQGITEAEAKAEGVEFQYEGFESTYKDYQLKTLNGCATARESFKSLWDKLNAKRGYGWNKNPYIFVIGFSRLLHFQTKSQETGKEVIAEKVQFYQWRG